MIRTKIRSEIFFALKDNLHIIDYEQLATYSVKYNFEISSISLDTVETQINSWKGQA